MSAHSVFRAAETVLHEGETLVLYSDGITEAEDPEGRPFEELGLELVVERYAGAAPAELSARVLQAVEAHAKFSRFVDDLTILVVKRHSITAGNGFSVRDGSAGDRS
jgi:sigma-B regulation protein RsbU (phosphoserine phosphatase)